ncbi:DUF3775 domain-containing protein [uncultured Phenylobacterium sp.]|uniref:DUF3775 domain-containing protein n=1 Tax=uncultured Phenylobacterium sp. TaxID=349273 RepID=UPI0025F47343|nr:DUF3775 domain-containing protein [uncultured Phenylobacterium sp.]
MTAAQSPQLGLDPETAFFIVLKAREFHTKVELIDPDAASEPADDRAVDVLQFHPDDSVTDELIAAIGSLNEEERLDLIALIWVGRGEYSLWQWQDARERARRIDPERVLDYILGMPMVSDFLEEGLSRFGHHIRDHLNSGFVGARDELLPD